MIELGQTSAPSADGLVNDVTEASFMADVVERYIGGFNHVSPHGAGRSRQGGNKTNLDRIRCSGWQGS